MNLFCNNKILVVAVSSWSALTLSFANAETAQIAVASNFKSTIDKLAPAFKSQTNHDIVVSTGSTGKLYAQIINGAPFDLFLAADSERPSRLSESNFAVTGSVFTYAVGRLVLWDPAGGDIGPARLRNGRFRRLAMAKPELAPYGLAAAQILKTLDIEIPTGRAAYGENIGQAFAFVKTGNAEIGFVAMAQILSLPSGEQGSHWAPPGELFDPIIQSGVLLNHGEENPAATAFIGFLKSDEATAILAQSGYETK